MRSPVISSSARTCRKRFGAATRSAPTNATWTSDGRAPNNATVERMTIRPVQPADWNQMWPIFKAVVATETTYVFSRDTGHDEAQAYWIGPAIASWIAEETGSIVGMYKLIPNRRDLGSHVANASFMVDPRCHGRRIGETLGRHCLR